MSLREHVFQPTQAVVDDVEPRLDALLGLVFGDPRSSDARATKIDVMAATKTVTKATP